MPEKRKFIHFELDKKIFERLLTDPTGQLYHRRILEARSLYHIAPLTNYKAVPHDVSYQDITGRRSVRLLLIIIYNYQLFRDHFNDKRGMLTYGSPRSVFLPKTPRGKSTSWLLFKFLS